VQPPPTRYVERPDGVNIAYQVVGDGPLDLLYASGFISHLDLQWTDPNFARFLARMSSFARLIMFDKPGTGLSDPIPHVPQLEERASDIETVLDAVGSQQASIFGLSEGGPAAMLFTATRPDRVRSLLLCGTFPSLSDVAQDGLALEATRKMLDHWGEGYTLDVFAPSMASDARRRLYGTFERAAASPRMARALIEAVLQIDVRDVLGAITVPTLVVHISGDTAVPIDVGRGLAAAIPGATFEELEGRDHAFWLSNADGVAAAAERFFTGTVTGGEPDRALATVLFTDIVGSTERAAELGDREWRSVLERHDELVAQTVAEHRGRVVKNIGDGALSTFDGPARAVRCAEALCAAAVSELGLELRAGVHTGECEVMGDDLGGLAVHIGARVGSLADPGEVLVSGTVKDLVVGSDMHFADRGEHTLKGVPGSWRLYALGEERREQPRAAPLDGPADHMRRGDRVTVAMARRAPRLMRLGARLAARGT
jgi:class 3 adenylate cyclase